MRLLVINPNSTASMTAKIAHAARCALPKGVEVIAVTNTSGRVTIVACDATSVVLAILTAQCTSRKRAQVLCRPSERRFWRGCPAALSLAEACIRSAPSLKKPLGSSCATILIVVRLSHRATLVSGGRPKTGRHDATQSPFASIARASNRVADQRRGGTMDPAAIQLHVAVGQHGPAHASGPKRIGGLV